MPASFYSHPRLIQLIQQPQPEHDDAVCAVHEAEALVQDKRQELVQAEQQLTQAQAQLQQTTSTQQERWQLVRKLQAMQSACWNRSWCGVVVIALMTIQCSDDTGPNEWPHLRRCVEGDL